MESPQDPEPITGSSRTIKILLWVILGLVLTVAIVFGVAVWFGYSTFQKEMVKANKEAMIRDLNSLAAEVYKYRLNKLSVGRATASYEGYELPEGLRQSENAEYSAVVEGPDKVLLTAKSKAKIGFIKVIVGADGKLHEWIFEGKLSK